MSDDDTTIELSGLDKLIKAVKRDPPVIKVGILGDSPRPDGKSNASVGAAHEYGAPKANIPQRSFLRMPLADKLPAALEASGAFSPETMAHVVKEGTLLPWAKKVAAMAEAIVLEAFGSGGFGKWTALKPRTAARKKLQQILVESQQLRNSISSYVEES